MIRLTDRPDMTLDVYHGRKTTTQQQQQKYIQSLATASGSGHFGFVVEHWTFTRRPGFKSHQSHWNCFQVNGYALFSVTAFVS